ncbi:MAG: exodeoxyribonuclease VII large subunit, partial [Clostridiaceae bacterium]|nr:exodeoxyribonuclease VII large subunit [Clostridiaceae bacterium]
MGDGVVLSVSRLNRYVKSIIEQDMNLQTVFVQGEISNFTNHYKTGHYYMTIKDEFSAIKAVMFKSANMRLKFMPENSMSVIIRGRVAVFERDGVYQLYIDDMQPDGTGALSLAFEQLKNKLAAEGLFAPERKKAIPECPMRVGVVTSPTGAAIRDIINVVSRRFPLAELILCPAAVQGELAAAQIKAGIELFNREKAADVLIVGRGGGSIEELWAFNERIVAESIYKSHIPVISGVGHETDFTVADFVSDKRAPTPSVAAELAVPDINKILSSLQTYKTSMYESVLRKITKYKEELFYVKEMKVFKNPNSIFENRYLEIDRLYEKINDQIFHKLQILRTKTHSMAKVL